MLGSINGVNGASANTNVGIGTTAPAYALDVHGTGNFTGLVNFASGQTFPGTGSVSSVGSGAGLTGGPITGTGTLSIAQGGVTNTLLANPYVSVSPGTDLTGGGVVFLGASTTLSLDTTKVPQLGTANTFTGDQTVNGTVTATSFSGNGAGLTGVTAITPGLMNVALLLWSPPPTYSVGTNPFGVAFDGSNIWVTNNGSNNVTKLVAGSGAVVGTYSVGNGPRGVAFDGSNIWVANFSDNTVTKLLASTGAVVGTYSVGTNPWGVAFDGSNIWVTSGGLSTLTKLLASNGSVVGTYTVGNTPEGVAFDGSNIWVVNSTSGSVTKLQASNGAVVGTYAVGSTPVCVAFDGSNIWVANRQSNTMTKIPVTK